MMRLAFVLLWLLPFGAFAANPKEALLSAETLPQVQKLKKSYLLEKKLALLCESSARPQSLNPHCYHWGEVQKGPGAIELLKKWQRECEKHIALANWQELINVAPGELPEGCQRAWHRRREELIYRFGEEPSFLWQMERGGR